MQYSISHFKNQTFVLFLFRQSNGHHRAAALGIADVKGTTMESDDLIAHRKADAAAPGLGGALVKLLLYIDTYVTQAFDLHGLPSATLLSATDEFFFNNLELINTYPVKRVLSVLAAVT